MPQTKIQGKFYPLTESIAKALRKAKLSAAEWRIWSYLVQLDPFGDRYEDFDYLSVMSICDCSKSSFYRAIAKFQELKIFDFQSGGLSLRNLFGTSQFRKPEIEPEPEPPKNDSTPSPKPKPKTKTKTNEHSEPPSPPETNNHPEISDPWDELPETSDRQIENDHQNPPVSKLGIESQKWESSPKIGNPVPDLGIESQNWENQSSKPPSNIQSTPPQTLQSYSDFRRSLSEDERENFFNYVKEKTKNLRQPINDLEAWLASKNAANQNRWFVYYQNYQNYTRFRNPQDNQISNPSRRQKIAQWQEHLRQEKLAAARLQEESRRLQKSAKQSQTEHITEQNNSEQTTEQNNLNQTETESTTRQISPNHDSKSAQFDLANKFDLMLNHPQGTTKDTSSATPKPDSSSNRQINRNQGRKILRDLDLRQRLENSQDRDQGGES